MRIRFCNGSLASTGSLVLLVAVMGCSKSEEKIVSPATPLKPKAAATQLQQAFAEAPAEVKQTAAVASQILQSTDYEGAVQAIQVIKAQPNLSLDQGLAIHASEVSLERRLIQAMAAGDPKAKLAYDLLRRSRRD